MRRDVRNHSDLAPAPTLPSTALSSSLVARHRTEPRFAGGRAISSPPDADLHNEGLRKHREGRHDESIALLTAAVTAFPARAAPWSDLGGVLAHVGRLSEALECYDRALAIKPNLPEALNNRGIALVALGRLSEALESFDHALAFNRRLASVHNNRGGVLIALGDYAEALSAFSRALMIDRNHADALNNRGEALIHLRQPAEALKCIERALALQPRSSSAHINRGNALMELGRPQEALESYERALALDPNSSAAQSNRGNALRGLGRYAEALGALERAIALRPNHHEAFNNVGNLLMEMALPKEAATAYHAAVSVNPDYVAALSNYSAALIALKRPDEALTLAERAVELAGYDFEAHVSRGVALGALGREAEAVHAYDQAILLRPEAWLPHNNKGLALVSLGRIEEGQAEFRTAIRRAPDSAESYYNLGLCTRFDLDDPALAVMQALAKRNTPDSAGDRHKLHFALGKALDELGDAAGAFHHLSEGNAWKRARCPYDEPSVLETLDRTRSVYSREFMQGRAGSACRSDAPVFILGMPRSGSTLVEQIFASHPEVHGAGEILDLDDVLSEMGGAAREARLDPEAGRQLSPEDFSRIGEGYVSHIRARAPTARRISNKMPQNFRFAGLIALAMPGARILHVRRNPVDVCFSCYSTLFAENHPYAHDLAELGRYHRRYEALMAHWRTALPEGMMLDIDYEDLVADLEGQSRRILAHCGLEWDPNCLDFHQSRRPVRTASFAQVRRPLHRGSIGRWHAYEAFLTPLLAELGS